MFRSQIRPKPPRLLKPLWITYQPRSPPIVAERRSTAHLCTKILDFRGFDSSIILVSRGGILMSTGNLLESLGQAILVGMILVGKGLMHS